VQRRVLEFANLLRKSGVRVSVAESIDTFEALDELSFDDREVFRDALRSTMVKRAMDVPTFDRLFELYWSGFHDGLRQAFGDALGGLEAKGLDPQQLLERLREFLEKLSELDLDLSQLAQSLLTQDLSRLEQMIREAGEAADVGRIENMLQVGFFTRRVLEQLGAQGAGDQLQALLARLAGMGLPEEDLDGLRALIEKLQEALRASVRDFTQRELQKQNYDYIEKFRRETLLEKSFYSLTEEDIRRMREVVTRLAQKIKNILSIRRRRERKGKFDLHQTLRRNMHYGGVPFELIFKQRIKDRPKLVILCDISSSVANVSRFMLQFVYSLQEAFTKIRSFVFVAELGEVTHVFVENDISEAIEKALEGGDVINVYTRSNFGMAFHQFWQNHLAAIDKKTTVIVIGDARNNYNDARAWCLAEIHNKAKHVVWLNPESPGAWGFGDSVMDKYLPHTDVAEEVRNLRQLSQVVDRLVL
jgi:uncharacterized protein with von Willebrand factor type A (vWA) domain